MPSGRGGCQKRVEEVVNGNATVSETTTTNCVCTGAQLARRDAEFLARYAVDAERLAKAYNTCKATYDAAMKSGE